MAAFSIPALSDERVVETNGLATVTDNWIMVPDANGHSRTLIAVSRLTEVKVVKLSYPGLLVIAAALFLLAAAAFYSQQGDGAALPLAVAGLFFVIGYIGSRQATVCFLTTPHSEPTRTAAGSYREAAELARAIQAAQTQLA